MTQITWTAPALADLRAIDRWLTHQASRELALRTLGEIKFRVSFLENFPHGGRPELGQNFRVLRIFHTPYLILYRIQEEGVQILRIRHEREDWRVDP